MTARDRVWLGLDVGGTKVAGALVDDRGQVRERVELPTLAEGGFEVSFGQVAAVARSLVECAGGRGWRVGGAGAGFPGPLDPRAGVLHNPPNLPGWDGMRVGDFLADELGLPVVVENDANAAALGEARHGAGRGFSLVVYFTLGTGVGGGVVCDGRIFSGVRGAAAELGHLVVRAGGEPCRCGGRGCLEAYASGPALVRRARSALTGEGAGSLLAGVAPLTGEAVVEAVRQGDPVAVRAWEETMEYLAAGVVSAVHAFNPDVVVVGGGLAAAGDLLFAPLRRLVREQGMPYLVRDLEIRPAALGRDAGVVGAAVLVRDRLGRHGG
ncbi:MAG: ROK family protein [Bacillota bacterium]|nr:ROK family protein [Bacillota bacterium]